MIGVWKGDEAVVSSDSLVGGGFKDSLRSPPKKVENVHPC